MRIESVPATGAGVETLYRVVPEAEAVERRIANVNPAAQTRINKAAIMIHQRRSLPGATTGIVAVQSYPDGIWGGLALLAVGPL